MFIWQHVRNLLESCDENSKADSLKAIQRALEERTDSASTIATAIDNILAERKYG